MKQEATLIRARLKTPRAAAIVGIIDDDPSMLKALDRLLPSVGLQAQLFHEPLGFLSYASCNSVALAVIDIWMRIATMKTNQRKTTMRTRIMLAAALVAVLALTTVHAQTTPKMMPGKGFIPALRLYSPLEPFFAKTWRPSEIELVK